MGHNRQKGKLGYNIVMGYNPKGLKIFWHLYNLRIRHRHLLYGQPRILSVNFTVKYMGNELITRIKTNKGYVQLDIAQPVLKGTSTETRNSVSLTV